MNRSEIKHSLMHFLNDIDGNDNLALLYDNDPDGISAGVIMRKALERFTKKQVKLCLAAPRRYLGEDTRELLKQNKITKVITVDCSIDNYPEDVKETNLKMLIFDHHKLYNDLNSEDILLIKPQMYQDSIDPSQYCAAKLVFDFMSEFVDLTDLDWVTSIGILGDKNSETWGQVVIDALEKRNYEIPRDLYNSVLGQATNLIGLTRTYDENEVPEVFEKYYNAKGPEEIIASLQKYKVVEDEIRKFFNSKEFEQLDQIQIHIVKPKYKIGSILSTRLSLKDKHLTIIVISDYEDDPLYHVSGRRQDCKVKINDLLEECVKDFENSAAGGHIPAAGGHFPRKYITEFLVKLKENHKKAIE